MKTISSSRFLTSGIFAVAIIIWFAWLGLVVSHQAGWLPIYGKTGGSLSSAGQFGDSFGALASLMAALAAAAALSAFLRQRKEVAAQEFERNFFTLLNNLQILVSTIDVGQRKGEDILELYHSLERGDVDLLTFQTETMFIPSESVQTGQEALRALLSMFREEIRESEQFKDSKFIHRAWEDFYDLWHDDLGHFFRTCYHIYKMIDEKCPEDRIRYSRIARSHLSSSQIILIAYNCAVGEGRFKFKSLVEKYSILHNYHVSKRIAFFEEEFSFFRRMFSDEAFRLEEKPEFKYT